MTEHVHGAPIDWVTTILFSTTLALAVTAVPIYGALVGYSTAAILPVLATIAIVKVAQDSTEYSLHNTIQQALFLLTSREAKYKAKTAIDTFLVRAGDLGSTGLVFAGVQADLGVRGFAVANVLIAIAWLWVAMRLAQRHRAMSKLAEEGKVRTEAAV